MYKLMFKRLFDILMSSIAILILSIPLLLISILLLFTGENQVFYFQNRVGYKNKFFNIWKFATMIKNSPNLGTGSLTLRDDPRILKTGIVLRKTKINELPQIINIIFGDMSIVGPRPQMHTDFIKFPIDIQQVIYNAKPGLTGLGSLVFRDEEKWISEYKGDKHKFYKEKIAPYKGELEVWYQKNISFKNDVILILLTVWYIFYPKSNALYNVFKNLPKKPSHLS